MSQSHENSNDVYESFRVLMNAFFDRYPDNDFKLMAGNWLAELVIHRDEFPGKPGGWVGGIYYAIKSRGLVRPVHVILNEELEQVFDASMSAIRKRAAQICDIVEPVVYPLHP